MRVGYDRLNGSPASQDTPDNAGILRSAGRKPRLSLTRQLGSASHSKVIQGQGTIVRCFTLKLNTMGGQTQIL